MVLDEGAVNMHNMVSTENNDNEKKTRFCSS